MGVVPDINAIRVAAHQKKKKKNVVYPPVKKIHVPLDEKFEITTRLREADDKLLEEIRQDDLNRFLAEFQESEDISAIISGDAQLIAEYKQSQLIEAMESSVGKDALFQAAEERFKSMQQDEDLDSDGDIVVKKKQTEVPSKVIYRDEDGFQITREKWLELQSQKKGGYKVKKKQPEKKKDEPVSWGGGISQQRELEEKLEHERRIANQPLTRYEIDEITDKEFREAVHWDDPMRKHVQFSSRTVEKGRLRCPFAAPPNRFGIPPGYRWDGVVRGNGFEDKILKAANKRVEDQESLYIESVEFL